MDLLSNFSYFFLFFLIFCLLRQTEEFGLHGFRDTGSWNTRLSHGGYFTYVRLSV